MHARHPAAVLWSGAALLFAVGCSVARAPGEYEPAPVPSASASVWSPRLPLRHTGFVEIPSRPLRVPGLSPDGVVRAGGARLSYRFVPATIANVPLCVVSSGGPGVTSAMMQRGLGVRADDSGVLAELCHTLFIDQRNTGFSYNLGQSEVREGAERFSLGDNNPYTDAADFLWVTLDLVGRYPDLASLPLLVLGESYGGVRATLMVDLWHHPEAYETGQRRVIDDTLLAALRQSERDLGGTWAERVRYQVLIQPTLSGTRQDDASGRLFELPGSVIDDVAAEVGVSYRRCDFEGCVPYFNALNQVEEWGRSVYKYPEAAGWLERRFALANALLDSPVGTLELLAADPRAVEQLGPDARRDAWRLADSDGVEPEASWVTRVLGELGPDDRYFLPFNDAVFAAFSSAAAIDLDIDWLDPSYAELFLQNCRSVETLLTRASYDLVNYSPGLLSSLPEYEVLAAVSLEEHGEEDRPGVLHLGYADGTEVRVRSPLYVAGHGVISDQHEQLVADISVWLSQTPVAPPHAAP